MATPSHQEVDMYSLLEPWPWVGPGWCGGEVWGGGGPVHSHLWAPARGNPRAGEEECRTGHAITATTIPSVPLVIYRSECAHHSVTALAQAILVFGILSPHPRSPKKDIIYLSDTDADDVSLVQEQQE